MTDTTNNKGSEERLPLRTILFCSRNKDNKDIEGFKQRKRKFLSSLSDEDLMSRFEEFVFSGVPGEFCRFYASVNGRDNEKIRRNVIHFLVDHPDADMALVENYSVAAADRDDCKAERKWVFDYDADPALIDEFVADVKACDGEVEAEVFPTPNGFCVVTSRGFDARNLDLGGKWNDVALKRDASRCIAWKRKET